MQETKPALLNTTPLDPHPFGSGDFPTFRTGVIPESENSQVPPEDSSTMAPEASFYDEVAREALKAAEEIFREEDTSTTTIPLADLMEDPPLSVEDFLGEECANPTPSESDTPPRLTSPASVPTQATLWSAPSAPIIVDNGK